MWKATLVCGLQLPSGEPAASHGKCDPHLGSERGFLIRGPPKTLGTQRLEARHMPLSAPFCWARGLPGKLHRT